MNKCVNCDYTTENDEKFCPKCGSEIIAEEPIEENVPAIVEAPSGESAPKAPLPGKGKAITGMVLSACALGCCLPGLTTIVFSSLALVLGIVGMIISNQSIKENGNNTFNKLGNIFGKIAVIIAGIDLGLTFIGACIELIVSVIVIPIGFLGSLISAVMGFLETVILAILGVAGSVLVVHLPEILSFFAG